MELAPRGRLRRSRLVLALAAALIGGLSLLGWAAGIEPLIAAGDGLPRLPPTAGALLIVAAASLASEGRRARALAAAVLVAGAATVLAHLGHVAATGSAIPPEAGPLGGAPRPVGGVALLLGGVALLLRESPQPRRVWIAQFCALLACINAVRTPLSALPAMGLDLRLDAALGMAPQGSLAMLLIGLGILASRPDGGFMALVASPRPAGRLLRRLVLLGAGLPLAVGVLTAVAWETGVFGAGFGVLILICGNLVALYLMATAHDRADTARGTAEERLALANAELERRVAERTAALEEREAQLRAIGDNLPGAWIYSFVREPGGSRFLYLSAGVERITGLSVEAVRENPLLLYELIEPEHRALILAREEAARRNLRPMEVEVRKRVGGAERWSRISSRPRRLDGEQVVWDGIEVDITAQKRAEAELERDRHYLAALFACSQALLPASDTPAARLDALVRALGRLHDAAQAGRIFLMKNLTGPRGELRAAVVAELCAPGVRSSAELIGKDELPWSAVPPDLLADLAAGHPVGGTAESIAGRAPRVGEALRATGVRSILILPLRIGEAWWGIIGLHACDTERQWQEQEVLLLRTAAGLIGAAIRRWDDEDELRRREHLLATLFDLLPAGVSLVDGARRPLRVNRAMAQLVGLPAETIIEGAYRELRYSYPDGRPVHPDDFPTSRALRGETVRDAELGVRRPDGSLRWVGVSAGPVPIEGGGAALVAVDITERKAMEAERLAFERKLLETQRLESLGVLAGGVAHDFNNILAAILGHAELARLDAPEGSDAAESLAAIIVGARRAAGLTEQMLAYAGRGRFVSEEVLLNEVARELSALTRATLPPEVSVRFELDPGLAPVVADATQVRQVLLNLITNAAEAIAARGGPGAIAITTGRATLDEGDLAGAAFSAARPGPCCFVEVSDSGGGIADEVLGRIFEPFFSTKFTGRGLGLAAVQGIMRAHAGALFVRSAAGAGSSFRACFPAGGGPAR